MLKQKDDDDEVPGAPPDDDEDDDSEVVGADPIDEADLAPSIEQWIADAEAAGIKVIRKLPEEKSRNATKHDKKCFWDLSTILGWSNDKIAIVTGWTPESVGRHISRMADAEKAREEERKKIQGPPPQGQTHVHPITTTDPQFPHTQAQPPRQQPGTMEEEDDEEAEIPDPKYMRPEMREPFKERLKELKRIMKSEGVTKEKSDNIMETVSDIDSLLETPQNLERYLWRVQKVDPEVAKVICQRLFRVESRHRHYDEHMSHNYGDHYGYGGYDEYGYPIRDDGYGRGPPPPRQYRGYGPPPDRYGRSGRDGGISEEEAKRREKDAAARATELAEKNKKIEQLEATLNDMKQQIEHLREGGGGSGDVIIETTEDLDEEGNVIGVRHTKRPYETPEQQVYKQMMMKSLGGGNNDSKADREEAEKLNQALQEKTQAQMELKIQEMKSQAEKENLTLKHALETNQDILAKIEAKGAGGGGGGGEGDAEVELLREEIRGQTEIMKAFIKRGDKRWGELIDLGKFAIDPNAAATAELGKAVAGTPGHQMTEEELASMGWNEGGEAQPPQD